MATFQCNNCDFEGSYAEFKAHMSDDDRASEMAEQDAASEAGEVEPDDLCCPECSSGSAIER